MIEWNNFPLMYWWWRIAPTMKYKSWCKKNIFNKYINKSKYFKNQHVAPILLKNIWLFQIHFFFYKAYFFCKLKITKNRKSYWDLVEKITLECSTNNPGTGNRRLICTFSNINIFLKISRLFEMEIICHSCQKNVL